MVYGLDNDSYRCVGQVLKSRPLAIKAFYESHETTDNSNSNLDIWVTKFGMLG